MDIKFFFYLQCVERPCVGEHLVSDRATHIFKHLQDSAHYHVLCSADYYHVLDHTSIGFQLKIKEAVHIQREQLSLNQQLHHSPCKSKTILLILTLLCFISFLVITIIIISIVLLALQFNFQCFVH